MFIKDPHLCKVGDGNRIGQKEMSALIQIRQNLGQLSKDLEKILPTIWFFIVLKQLDLKTLNQSPHAVTGTGSCGKDMTSDKVTVNWWGRLSRANSGMSTDLNSYSWAESFLEGDQGGVHLFIYYTYHLHKFSFLTIY